MKRFVLLVGICLTVAMVQISCGIVAPLRNTTWESALILSISKRINFGDNSFKKTDLINGLPIESWTGTYTIIGENVTLTAEDGNQWVGRLIGNSLTLDEGEFWGKLEFNKVQ
ncbi:hypothetical protein FACS1894161_1130 [Spirochaetia bacterium]|nr:hypothetical protein FACS1894161_1130 [Spirochaetia bacterium]